MGGKLAPIVFLACKSDSQLKTWANSNFKFLMACIGASMPEQSVPILIRISVRQLCAGRSGWLHLSLIKDELMPFPEDPTLRVTPTAAVSSVDGILLCGVDLINTVAFFASMTAGPWLPPLP